MTLRVPVSGLIAGEQAASEEVVRYVMKVHRLATGAPFVAFDPTCAMEADATLEERGGVLMLVAGALATSATRATRAVVLVQGLPKGDKDDAVVRDATELGATAVVFVRSARSVVRLDDARLEKRMERWQRIAIEAARQAGRGDVPRVTFASGLAAALTSELERGAGGLRAFVLAPSATVPLGARLPAALATGAPLLFACGPEGGFDDREIGDAVALGGEAVSLGPFVLRTETVAAAVLGAARILEAGARPSP